MKFYQVEARIGGVWTPIPGQTYGCAPHVFRQMLDLLAPLVGQRVRCVGDCFNPQLQIGELPVYLYSVKTNTFREWPQNST